MLSHEQDPWPEMEPSNYLEVIPGTWIFFFTGSTIKNVFSSSYDKKYKISLQTNKNINALETKLSKFYKIDKQVSQEGVHKDMTTITEYRRETWVYREWGETEMSEEERIAWQRWWRQEQRSVDDWEWL